MWYNTTFVLCAIDGHCGGVSAGGHHLQRTIAASATHVLAVPVCVWSGGSGPGLLAARGVGACVAVGASQSLTCQTLPSGLVVPPHSLCSVHHNLGQKVMILVCE